MKKTYQLGITLKEELGKTVFAKTYKIALWGEFVKNTTVNAHGFKNHVR